MTLMTNDRDFGERVHRHGPAGDVPALLKSLVSRSADRRDYAYGDLQDRFREPATWFDAGPPTAAWLLEHALTAPQPGLVWSLLADLIGADHRRAWVQRCESTSRDAAPTVSVVEAKLDVVLKALEHKKLPARCGAAAVASLLPSHADALVPVLMKMAEKKRGHVAIRASAILALARLSDVSRAAKTFVDDHEAGERDPETLRGVWALARWRAQADGSLEDGDLVLSLNTDLFMKSDRALDIVWFGGLQVGYHLMGDFLGPVVSAVRLLAEARDQGEARYMGAAGGFARVFRLCVSATEPRVAGPR